MPHAGDPLKNQKREARRLLQAVLDLDPQALERVEKHHSRFPQIARGVLPRRFRREDAQFVVAREAGFSTWAAMKASWQTFAKAAIARAAASQVAYESAIALLKSDRFLSHPHDTLKKELREKPTDRHLQRILSLITDHPELVTPGHEGAIEGILWDDEFAPDYSEYLPEGD